MNKNHERSEISAKEIEAILEEGRKNPLSEEETRKLLSRIFEVDTFKSCYNTEEEKQELIESILKKRQVESAEKPTDDRLKRVVSNLVEDLVGAFCYYDRKESSTLSLEQLNDLVRREVITVNFVVDLFRKGLEAAFESIKKDDV